MVATMNISSPYRKVSNYSFEKGYSNEFIGQEYPLRVFKTGKYSGLTVWLSSKNVDYQKECQGTEEGYKITLSMPGEAGQMSKRVYHLPTSESADIAIKSKLTITSDGLQSYEPHLRQCFFNSERQLRFFKLYTQNNCEIECLANFTKSRCNCVKFSMPSKQEFYFMFCFSFLFT